MTLRDELIAERNRIDQKLAILDRVGEDTFNIGAIALFASSAGDKWYYLKEAEEAWRFLNGQTQGAKQLRSWILEAEEANIGYFEVYLLSPANTPFYASA